MQVEPPVPLSVRERAILDLVLSPDFSGAIALREQAVSAMVVGRCDCGCPTVDLRTDGPASLVPFNHGQPPVELDALAEDGETSTGQIVVFVDHGRLDRLEYCWTTDDVPTRWPALDRTRLVDRDAGRRRRRSYLRQAFLRR